MNGGGALARKAVGPSRFKTEADLASFVARQTVAFQGEPGAYSEEAAYRFFGDDVDAVPYESLDDVFRAIASGKVDRAVAALENSQAGSINRTYDLLRRFDLYVVGEVVVPIDHCILALPGQTLADIKRVHSHPSALEQTERFVREMGAEGVVHYDTAGSAKMIAEKGLTGEGAVASKRAAGIYGLEVLAEAVQTIKENRTRFMVLDRAQLARGEGEQKTAIVMATDDRPGALYEALGAFASRGINLTKLESRPSRGKPFESVFYIDFLGHRDDDDVREALADLTEVTSFVKVLGSFARNDQV